MRKTPKHSNSCGVQLIEESSDLSGARVARLKQFIVKNYLINLPGFGTVILRSNKERFQVAVKALERYVHRFQRQLRKKLQQAIDQNREVLTGALLPSVLQNPPTRWNKFLGEHPGQQAIIDMFRLELIDAFGQTDDVFEDMNVKAIFKGVTYELLSDPVFMRIASHKIPNLATLHDEYDAAPARPRLTTKVEWHK